MVERAEVRRWNKAVHKTDQMFLREHGFLPDDEFDLTLEGGKFVQQSKKRTGGRGTMNKKKEILQLFIGPHQLQGLTLAAQGIGEASRYFQGLLNKLRSRIVSMPKTYQTDGQGDKAIAQLHYYIGRSHWFVTERDMILPEQIQAYGYVCLNGDIYNAEKGFIDVDELVRHGAVFDVYFKPAPLSEVKAELVERRALWDTNY